MRPRTFPDICPVHDGLTFGKSPLSTSSLWEPKVKPGLNELEDLTHYPPLPLHPFLFSTRILLGRLEPRQTIPSNPCSVDAFAPTTKNILISAMASENMGMSGVCHTSS